jgi:Mrp family chromosome partitioning ATPase
MSNEPSLDGVFEALNQAPVLSGGGGRVVLFIAARRGEGVSTVARTATLSCGQRTAYCIDLDLRRNAMIRAFQANDTMLGPRLDGRLAGRSFYQIQHSNGEPARERSPAFGFHRIAASRAYVGSFDPRVVPPDGRVMISQEPAYWNAVRAGGAIGIVDAPALERSMMALRLVKHMDGVVLVVGRGAGAAPAAVVARDQLQTAGANLLGLVYAGASAPVIAIDKIMRKSA